MLWPITAGGLGLLSATIYVGQYQIAYRRRVKSRVKLPKERLGSWQNQDNDWYKFYDDQFVEIEPAKCAESAAMKAMVDSFIRRGKSISGGDQVGLGEYWRWMLSIYGPEKLERLGTFEFLITELMPLQLIQERR